MEEDGGERGQVEAAAPALDLVVVGLGQLAGECRELGVLVELGLPAASDRRGRAGAVDERDGSSSARAIESAPLSSAVKEMRRPLGGARSQSHEKFHGPDHPDVANILNSLAVVASLQKRNEEAERLLSRALPIYEKALGATSPARRVEQQFRLRAGCPGTAPGRPRACAGIDRRSKCPSRRGGAEPSARGPGDPHRARQRWSLPRPPHGARWIGAPGEGEISWAGT